MNRQETYAIVRDHLMTQMKESVSIHPGMGCAYQGANGLKCAIGCLIPDELYNVDLEGKAVFILPKNILNNFGVETEEDIYFLRDLQLIHDTFVTTDWGARLYNFAVENGLQP